MILPPTSLWPSARRCNHAHAMGQPRCRKTVHHPCMIHQLLDNLRKCVTRLCTRSATPSVSMGRHNVATSAVACLSFVSLTPITSSTFIRVLRPTCFEHVSRVQLLQHRAHHVLLVLDRLLDPQSRCLQAPHPSAPSDEMPIANTAITRHSEVEGANHVAVFHVFRCNIAWATATFLAMELCCFGPLILYV